MKPNHINRLSRLGWALAVCLVVSALPEYGLAQQPSTPATAPAAQPQADLSGYSLGPGDVVTLTVVNHPEFSGDFTVPAGGTIAFPVVGDVNVLDKSISDVNTTLLKMFRKELLHPKVSLSLKTSRLQQAFVYGDVQRPGAVAISPGMRLADAFNSAGGLSPEYKIEEAQVTVTGRNGSRSNFSLTDLLSGKEGTNRILQDGDTLSVDTGWFVCYVGGQVKTPGQEKMKRGASILEAIAAAGGTTDTAAIQRVEVRHTDNTVNLVSLVPEYVKGDIQKLPPLKTGDIVTVPLLTDSYSVLGYVNTPGVFPLMPGKVITLADAISTASGHEKAVDRRASLSKVSISHQVNGKSERHVYNLGKYFSKGDTTQNPQIEAGDVVFVPQSNAVNSSLLVAGLASLGVFYYYVIGH
jgi:polysaccharide export outer membrane protein